VPEVVRGEVVPTEEIPVIGGPTVDGIVEIARGCGRGCDFCVPTLQLYRSLPIDHILREVEVNLRAGRQPTLHAEDVLRYKAKGLEINREAVVGLFKAVKNHPGVKGVGISHFALSSVASAPDLIGEISGVLGASDDEEIGGQTGIETGSPRLIEKHMMGKCKPFKPEDWQDIVVGAFEVLSENHWVPCSTLILGLPGETEKDVELTIELVEKLERFKSLIVPLFFVAMGGLWGKATSFTRKEMTPMHSELIMKCWEHNFSWVPTLLEKSVCPSMKRTVARFGLKLIAFYGIKLVRKIFRACREDYGSDLNAMIQDIKSGEVKVTPLPVRLISPLIKAVEKANSSC